MALAFGPAEYFAVYFLAFASFVGMGGAPPVKTLVSLAIGFAIAAIGIDTVSGSVRLTMGIDELVKGVNFVVAVMGLFGIGELLIAVEENLHAKRRLLADRLARGVRRRWPACRVTGVALLRSAAIGCWMGITPGGPTAASFMSYGIAKRFSPRRREFRQGRARGHRRAGDGRSCRRHQRAAADAGAGHSRLGDRGGHDGRADDLGPQSRARCCSSSRRISSGA